MDDPGTGPASLGLAKREPRSSGTHETQKDVLGEDAPGERRREPQEFVQGPKADELRIVEPPGDNVLVSHVRCAALAAAIK